MRFVLIGSLVLAAALGACGDDSSRGGAPVRDTLRDGGRTAFKARLAELRGTPVVVNQWASWCGPCRFEFPFLKSQAEKLRGKVTFLGVNAKDSRDDAARFLAEHPVPFENFYDPKLVISRLFRGGRSWPTTAFYDAAGRLVFTHQGAYADEQQLATDIKRYSLDG